MPIHRNHISEPIGFEFPAELFVLGRSVASKNVPAASAKKKSPQVSPLVKNLGGLTTPVPGSDYGFRCSTTQVAVMNSSLIICRFFLVKSRVEGHLRPRRLIGSHATHSTALLVADGFLDLSHCWS